MSQQNHTTGQFRDLTISDKLLTVLTNKGFTTPTPIQDKVIPAGIAGQDVIGIAQTGTGKTLAFGIPIIERIINSDKQALIITPTRELALQVEEALLQIGRPLGLKTTAIIGGQSQHPQVKSLQRNPDIVIATPGRLTDLIKQKKYNVSRVGIITLDEADRMLDEGFLPEIKRILTSLPKPHQTLLFSATMPKTISELASTYMKSPLRVAMSPQGTTAKHVDQAAFVVDKSNKLPLLQSILDDNKEKTTLVFSRTKHGAKRIAQQVRSMGHTATEIHSNRSQNQRKKALQGFSNKRFRVMVATDIAARGIDVTHLSLVINYDLPDNSEDYVHRIGRTGRAGKSGTAISFISPDQKRDKMQIERLMKKTLTVQDHPLALSEKELKYGATKGGGNRGGRNRYSGNRNRGRSNRSGRNRSRNRNHSSSRSR